MDLQKLAERLNSFESDAHRIFGQHEAARSRVVILSASYDKLDALSLQQDELMRQALRCVEGELYRAAHVLAWAGFIDLYEERLASDGFVSLKHHYPAWNTTSVENLRESVAEYQLIEAGRKVHLLSKNDVKALQGLLNKRNECAHPSGYHPELNDSLGYFSELLQRIDKIRSKVPSI